MVSSLAALLYERTPFFNRETDPPAASTGTEEVLNVGRNTTTTHYRH